MEKFAFLFREAPQTLTPEAQATLTQSWYAWMGQLAQSGTLANPGEPLRGAGKVLRGTGKVMTDGPFTETKEFVNGFIVVSAADIDAAVLLAQGCPVFGSGGSVEVRPVMQM